MTKSELSPKHADLHHMKRTRSQATTHNSFAKSALRRPGTIHLLAGFQILLCLFVGERRSFGETNRIALWRTSWRSATNPAGGQTVVMACRRFEAIPQGEALATEDELDRTFKKPADGDLGIRLYAGYGSTNGTELLVKHYTGPFYFSPRSPDSGNLGGMVTHKQATVISTLDNRVLVAGVRNGPIYSSTNSGLTWKTISTPGQYSIPIVEGSGGCGLFAVQTIPAIQGKVSSTDEAGVKWYVFASGKDGSGLVLTGGTTEAIPILNIAVSGDQMVVSWPATAANYVLQEQVDLTASNWTDVGIKPTPIAGQLRVKLRNEGARRFFRLTPR